MSPLSHRCDVLLVLCLTTAAACGDADEPQHESQQTEAGDEADAGTFALQLPAWFPEPHVPADNPMSGPAVELGRHLFHDAQLSENRTQSCASCHQQALAFTDGRARALGSTGQQHARGALSLANVAYAASLTWADPAQDSLERQALLPLLGEHPVELGMAGREAELIARLEAEPRYRELFTAAFPGDDGRITIEHITRALAAFERTLLSGDSPYDRYLDGEHAALDARAVAGMKLFFSDRAKCFRCHGGFNLDATALGEAPSVSPFHNTGLYDVDGRGSYPDSDTGLHAHTGIASDMGRFRTPSLRNIAVTGPYMHDGSVASLEDVIEHYAAGGRTLDDGPNAGVGRDNPHKSPLVTGFEITAREKQELLAFLQSLTDQEFLDDVRFANPW